MIPRKPVITSRALPKAHHSGATTCSCKAFSHSRTSRSSAEAVLSFEVTVVSACLIVWCSWSYCSASKGVAAVVIVVLAQGIPREGSCTSAVAVTACIASGSRLRV